ncbi:FAR-17a/AIG1-like protein [Actinopolyspora lacussalsi subsp. righensis]|uniref:FAR-17a/AIG1-like protein n=2 Tax=Actinopolyspora righensis TaxID=995060 RepID=A0A1I7AMH2_9ACTN|nr:FAR-17a/AIG1-like protein [Actinopolyspora righensis]
MPRTDSSRGFRWKREVYDSMLSSRAWPVRLPRILLGALAVIAVGRQFAADLALPDFSPVNFFSYFTILSNIAAGALLIRLGAAPGRDGRAVLEWLRGGMTVYMATTGTVFALLLDGGDSLPWVNTVMHHVMPVVMFVDWLLVRPRARIRYTSAFAWLTFPLVYVVYSLVRGAVTGWFPYPFLRPGTTGGVDGVALYLVVMTICIALAAMLVAWLGNIRVREPEPVELPEGQSVP